MTVIDHHDHEQNVFNQFIDLYYKYRSRSRLVALEFNNFGNRDLVSNTSR